VRVEETRLEMDPLTDAEIDEYLATGAWEGKAGAFGYQDRLGWVHVVEGSESNVVGLPLELLAQMIGEIQRPKTSSEDE
jgi:septum formation protein